MKQNEAICNCAHSVIFQTKHLYTLQLLQAFRYAAANPPFFGAARLKDFKKNTHRTWYEDEHRVEYSNFQVQ